MSPPVDLAALRALVEAGDSLRYRLIVQVAGHGVDMNRRLPPSVQQTVDRWDGALPAAREALERVEDILLKDRIKTNEINILTKENREQAARLARLEGIHREVVKRIHDEDDPDSGRPWLVDQVLPILEGHPTQGDAERPRVHGPVIQGDAAVTSEVSAQAARDVAHWRTRAENAEARLAQLEGRDE